MGLERTKAVRMGDVEGSAISGDGDGRWWRGTLAAWSLVGCCCCSPLEPVVVGGRDENERDERDRMGAMGKKGWLILDME